MKKANSIIIATVMATFVISMFGFQPTKTEASINVSPTATPSPRKIRKVPTKSIEVENDETHITRKPITKAKAKKPAVREGGANDTTQRTTTSKPTAKGYQSLPELDANPDKRKRKTTKSSKSEVSIETLERRKQTRKRKN